MADNNDKVALAPDSVSYVGSASSVTYVGTGQQTRHPPQRQSTQRQPPKHHNGIPVDYNSFVDMFAEPIRRQVTGFGGLDRNDIDDIAQNMLLQFIAGDYLNVYSATTQNAYAEARYNQQMELFRAGKLDYEPVRHVGKFSSFVFEFVKRRLMGTRDQNNKRIMIMRSLDAFVNKQDSDETPARITELSFFGIMDDEYQNIEVRNVLTNAFQYLIRVTSPTETRNFPELFMQMVNDTFEYGEEKFDRESYAIKKRITVSAVNMQVRELRQLLEQAGVYKEFRTLVASRNRHARKKSF